MNLFNNRNILIFAYLIVPSIFANASQNNEQVTEGEVIYFQNNSLAEGQFKGNVTIKEVYLSDEVSTLPNECFSGCAKLEKVHGKSIVEIGSRCFEDCNSLQYVGDHHIVDNKVLVIPIEWNYIGTEAFTGIDVEELDITGNEFLTLCTHAFCGLTELKKARFSRPSGIETQFYISRYESNPTGDPTISSEYFIVPFVDNPALEEVIYSDDYIWVSDARKGDSKLEDAAGSSGLIYEPIDYFDKIKSQAYIQSLKRIVIKNSCHHPVGIYNPEAELYIDSPSFSAGGYGKIISDYSKYIYTQDLTFRWDYGWMLGWKYLRLGPNVTSFSGSEFDNLEQIIVEAKNPFENARFSDNVYKNALLIVPEGSEEAYRNSNRWGQFENIKSMDLSGVEDISVGEEISVHPEYYDLTGRRVTSPEKGIYIVKDSRGVRKVIF